MKLLHYPQGGPLALARTTGHAASTGDVATTATDWVNLAPLAGVWLMANVANPANPANLANQKPKSPDELAKLATLAGLAISHRLETPPAPAPGIVPLLALACTTGVSCGKIGPKPRGPVRRNTKSVEVATPTDERGFVTPQFFRYGLSHSGMVYGHGVGYPQGHPHGYGRVSNRHAHPLCVETQRVVLHPVGAKTMQQVTLARTAAPTPKAAPAIPTTTAHALLEATTSASLAGFYLRKGNLTAARRKAVQLLKALQVMEVAV
ncbi:hypothetical protein [Giesbergeria anulus]|uniref:hypothetical protein n=1 Tax=Giesbergeria anulus TaxID=180197 RepID=UPI00115FAD45|nr:hypothetical protein [Giesbergeria anulus]